MKKTILVLGLAMAGAAGAQNLQVSAGGALTGGNLGFHAGVAFQDVTELGEFPLDLRINGDFVTTFPAVSATAILNAPTSGINLYGGAGLGIGLGNTNRLFATFVGGVATPIADEFSLFAEAGLRLNAPSVVRFGVMYNF